MIQLKGTAEALRCVVPETIPDADLPGELSRVLAEGAHMLSGAKVVLDFQGRNLSGGLLQRILEGFVWPGGMTVLSWKSLDGATLERFKAAGLPVGEPVSSVRKGQGLQPALCLRRSLRSGQRVEHRGDVVVCGHVNDGAEVFALGHVVVLGRLQGLVHAGMEGDDEATVSVRVFEATQVRIGCRVGSMDRGAPWWGHSVLVSVEEDSVVVGDWPGTDGDLRRER